MKTSLANLIHLSPQSAAIFAGTTLGEINLKFNKKNISLAELYSFAKEEFKAGNHDSVWFNGEAAQKDPVLRNSIDKLIDLISISEISDEFRTLLSSYKVLTLGILIENIRILVGKYEHVTGPIAEFVNRLSKGGAFELQ